MRAHRYPAASLRHRFARSPTDTLIDHIVRCRLRRQVPIGPNVHPRIRLRIAVLPQRWPARRGYVWWLRVNPDVIKDLADLHALGDKYDQAHLPTRHRAQQRHGIGSLKREKLEHYKSPVALGTMRAIKQAQDPETMNPGRVL